MFEQELELEKKQSSFGPLLLVVVLVGLIGGFISWFIYQQNRKLGKEEAVASITTMLADRGPVTLKFEVGDVVDDRPSTDAKYRLLTKIGIVTVGKAKGNVTPVTFTADGEKRVTEIPGFNKKKDDKKAYVVTVPLASRKLVSVENIEMLSPTKARVQYIWKWDVNALGKDFDAAGKYVQAFNTWDRSELIQKHGVDFYSAAPATTSVVLVKADEGWKRSSE